MSNLPDEYSSAASTVSSGQPGLTRWCHLRARAFATCAQIASSTSAGSFRESPVAAAVASSW